MQSYRDYWYHSDDGLRLYARDYPCRGTAEEPVINIVCMHGLSRNSADFTKLAEHLSDRFRVISVDQRGRGKSAYDATVANYTPATYVRDMFVLLDELALEQVILIGTSMGGLMAFMMAAMQPERIKAMVINDIGPQVDPVGLARIQSYVGKSQPVHSWGDAIAQAKAINGLAFEDFNETQWREFTAGIYHDEDGVPVLSYDPAISGPMGDKGSGAVPPDLWPMFEAISATPMLLLRGAQSDILSPDCVRGMQQRKADLHHTEIPRRGHAPTLDEPDARFAIDQFLAQQY